MEAPGITAAPARRAPGHRRPHVVIAGGGVAAIEALIALHDLLDGFVHIDVVAPKQDFVYRPLSVAEPFGLTVPRRFPMRDIVRDHGAELHMGRLVAVNNDQRVASVRGGPSLDYDVLFVAVGAQPRDWLPGAIHFAGPDDVARVRTVVEDLDREAVGSIAFAAPPGLSWTLPLYELALLTATRVAERGQGDVRLSLLTGEHAALEVFGPAAARHIRELCGDRGIELKLGAQAISFHGGRLELADGSSMRADRVIALPKLEGDTIDGLPHDSAGFIPVDRHGAVRGLPGVYAAGDGVAYPVKQGGLATQQADAAAEAIAARLGAAIEPQPFRARLRGQLLTGLGPTYLTAGATEAGPHDSTVAVNPLWWPPSKIAGRYIAPYLAGRVSLNAPEQLADRPTVATMAPAKANPNRDGLRDLALDFADLDAAAGDYASALRWLETVEQLDGMLSPALAQKQAEWRERA